MDPRQAVGGPLSSDQLRAAAIASGFDLCGLSRAEPIPPEVLTEWLEAGMAAGMDWMKQSAADRLDASRLLPGARTVLSLACGYYVDDPETERSPIARYARGRDYHATMKDRLRALRRRLGELRPGLHTYGGADALPVMEKVWAARGGLGYVGRNGCLVTERFGSYVLLATLVLDAEVDAYAPAPAPDRCGDCGLCLSACPTSAILEGGRVDARRCLSYQTIENRSGAVPEELRPALSDMVFGCDLCQDVCPLNRAPATAGPRFLPRAVAKLGVREIAMMTKEQYDALVPGTPLARAKLEGLRRNAAYALGAARDGSARGVLEALAGDPSGRVSEAARWALRRLDQAGAGVAR